MSALNVANTLSLARDVYIADPSVKSVVTGWEKLTELALSNSEPGELADMMASKRVLGHHVQKVSAAEWKRLQQSLTASKAEDTTSGWLRAANLATVMQVLAADEVRVTKEKGLELIMHSGKKLRDDTPPVPEKADL